MYGYYLRLFFILEGIQVWAPPLVRLGVSSFSSNLLNLQWNSTLHWFLCYYRRFIESSPLSSSIKLHNIFIEYLQTWNFCVFSFSLLLSNLHLLNAFCGVPFSSMDSHLAPTSYHSILAQSLCKRQCNSSAKYSSHFSCYLTNNYLKLSITL